jgi:hypothetical protein
MCIFCLLFGLKLSTKKLPPLDTTFSLPTSFWETQNFIEMVEWPTIDYITSQLKDLMPHKVVPLQTTGDGDCLLHAISRALWGVEQYSDLLRQAMLEELQNNAEWYKNATSLADDFDNAIRQAREKGQRLSFLHVFALSNFLKRPIIVYAGDADIEKFGTGEVRIYQILCFPSIIQSIFVFGIDTGFSRDDPGCCCWNICSKSMASHCMFFVIYSQQ